MVIPQGKQLIPIMEHFATIQGEGFHTGAAAYFIRTGGCDVGCHWCDVKESWPMEAHPKLGIDQIGDLIRMSGFPIAVITGGEPAMHDLGALTNAIKRINVRTHIETSGAYPLTGMWDWITVSPKKFKEPLMEVLKMASELKVIINHPSDFDFAEKHAKNVNEKTLLYLQPEWDKRERMMPLIVDYVKKNPRWKISLQTHKYLNIP